MSLYIKTADGWKPLVISFAPCSNSNDLQGVYRPEPIEAVRAQYASRLTRFIRANGLSMMEKQAHFRGHSFIEPIYGAFGEKL